MEERAEDYLEDLVERCLVQVIEKSWSGYCRYCGMHDLVRDLAIHEAKEKNFFTVFIQQISVLYSVLEGVRYQAMWGFAAQLRVLVIENIDFKEIKVGNNWLANLVHMRYMGFRNRRTIEKIVVFIENRYMGFRNCRTTRMLVPIVV